MARFLSIESSGRGSKGGGRCSALTSGVVETTLLWDETVCGVGGTGKLRVCKVIDESLSCEPSLLWLMEY